MANVDVTAAVVRVASQKIAEAHGAQLSVPSGDKAVFGADGYLGHTQGATQGKITIKAIMPKKGMAKKLSTMVINKTRSDVSFFGGGQEWTLNNAACVQFDVDSETETGMLEGTFVFEAGVPSEI